MATLDENLIAFVLADTSIKDKIGDRLHFGHVPQNTAFPRGLLTRAGSRLDGCLDDAAGTDPTRQTFTLEFQGTKLQDAEALMPLAIDRLNCYRGAVGDVTVQGIFAEDWSSGHVSNTPGDDTGIFTASCPVEVVL